MKRTIICSLALLLALTACQERSLQQEGPAREMGFAVITVQILTIVGTVTIDIMNASAERTDISTVVLNLDDKING